MQLNNEQQAAVTATERRILVLASAGAGKTRVLIERIAYLVEKCKVSPYEIIAFTFTRKAAGEMKQRLEDRLGSQAYGVTMATMHAIALKFIRRYGERIGLRPHNVTVYSEWEEQFLLKQVATEMGVFKKSWKVPKKDIDAAFNVYYNDGVDPENLDDINPKTLKLFKYFFSRCRENNAMTYGELIHGMYRLLPEIKKYSHFKHILCDETQDNDGLQWHMIEDMCKLFDASLFVVGDDSQCAYQWRGSRPEYLVENQDLFKIYKLRNNYRSGSDIVESANRLIVHNENRLPLTMVPKKDSTGSIIHCAKADSETLVEYIKLHKPQAVLSRTHILLQFLARRLDESGIPYHYVGKKTKLVNTESFRRFHAFLKLIINPYDNFAFMLIKDIIGVSNSEYADIRYRSSQSSHSHFQQWALENEGSRWEKYLLETPRIDFMQIVSELDTMLEGAPCDCDAMHKAFWFAGEWWDQAMNPEAGVSEYLEWLATYDLQDEMVDDDERMQLTTIHGAKGLEWPSVMLIGCNEGVLPSTQALKNDDIEGERRLAYVAITRAEDELILAVRPTITEGKNGRQYLNPISRFMKEMTS